MRVASCLSLVLVAFVGCSDSSEDGDGDGGGGNGGGTGAGTGPGGSVCYDVPVNTTDGGEACGDVNCPAGQYCEFVTGSDCSAGCLGSATCPQNQFCDLSTGPVGTCRTPGPEHEIPCMTAASSSTGGTPSCLDICDAKLDLCGGGAPPGICDDVCTVATQEQQECLQAAACEDFNDGEECGLSFGGGGE